MQPGSGILLHPTSLPGKFGCGDFGAEAYQFVDWLVSAGQTYWQVLPLGEIGPGNSPYMSSSAFAGGLHMISLADLASYGWLQASDLEPLPEFRADPVNFNPVNFALTRAFRMERLHLAAKNFFANPHHDVFWLYEEFCSAESAWLEDYALFMTIAAREQWRDWTQWPSNLAQREAQSLLGIKMSCPEEIAFWKFCQWSYARQWLKLKHYANGRGIKIIGDVPIFVAYQSADVWAHQGLFELDENGRQTVVAGVPPDYFSETGQLWGNPLYRWRIHEETDYAWWIARLRRALQLADLVRIDHFRGFVAYWEIPVDAVNAIGGRWQPGPGAKLFEAFNNAFSHLPIIAEDLGLITPDVLELRDQLKLPGMRVLQFAFGDRDDNPFLPHNYVANTVAYTGTHDNDTAMGWWHTLPENQQAFARNYLGCDGHAINWDMMKALSHSVADWVIFPLQDVLGLPSEHRMNFPGKPDGNWGWRFSWDQIQPEHTLALAEMSAASGRSEVLTIPLSI